MSLRTLVAPNRAGKPYRTRAVLAAVVCALMASYVSAADPDVVGRKIAEMFQVGFERGSNPQKEARRLYESALSLSKNDPRVDYAFGLVLLKQVKNKEAMSQFQQAVNSSGSTYLPAVQALIWMNFVAKDYPAGYEQLRSYAKRVATSEMETSEKEQAAEWIGQVLAALQMSVDSIKQRDTLKREDEAVTGLLGTSLKSALSDGRVRVHSLHALMEGDIQQAREIAQAKEQKERADKEAQVAKNLESSAEKREELKKSSEDSKKAFEQQIAAFDKQLARLERDYDFLQKRVLSLTASQIQINGEMALLSQQSTSAQPRNANPFGQQQLAQAYQQRMSLLEAQAFRYQFELDQTLASTINLSQRAQVVAGQRTATVRQYERLTGQIVQQDSALDKWQERLKKDGEKLKEQPKPKGAVTNKVQQVKSFRTYVDLDLNLERDRVLDSFGVAMPDKQAGK